MEFKKLELKPEGSWIKRTLSSKQLRKSIIAIIIGGIAGFAYFYFTEGQQMKIIPVEAALKSILIGGFFGFFVTNSPCARGRC